MRCYRQDDSISNYNDKIASMNYYDDDDDEIDSTHDYDDEIDDISMIRMILLIEIMCDPFHVGLAFIYLLACTH